MKMSRKEIILSTIAGLATIAIGYLVWRHEEAVSAARSSQDQSQEQALADQLSGMLVNAAPSVSPGVGGAEVPYSDGGASSAIPTDNNLAAIIQALMGTSGSGSTSGASGSGSTSGASGSGSTAGASGSGSTAGTSGSGSTGTAPVPPAPTIPISNVRPVVPIGLPSTGVHPPMLPFHIISGPTSIQ